MIARVLRQHPRTRGWDYLSHVEALAAPEKVRGAARVINFAFDPRLRSNPYDKVLDVDLQLACLLATEPVNYIMASTRMVYGPAHGDFRLSEYMETRPTTHYGASKLECEARVSSVLGDRLTVLRFPNVFDISEAEGGRRSFFGQAMRTLRSEGQIVFDMSPFVARDFLPASLLATRLSAIAEYPVPGVFNLGAGFPAPTGRIAQWLIEGYGSGDLVIKNFREFDSFWLDTKKAMRTWGFEPLAEQELRAHCVAAGTALRSAA
jgi:nucleoside-diphosphate-sugar epimerase